MQSSVGHEDAGYGGECEVECDEQEQMAGFSGSAHCVLKVGTGGEESGFSCGLLGRYLRG